MKQKLSFLIMLVAAQQLLLAQSTQVPDDFGFKAYQTGQAFTSITVDQNDNVWAGTNKQGFFKKGINDSEFSTLSIGTPDLGTVAIESIAADQLGNVWVGHSGINFNNGQGGLERLDINSNTTQRYSPDRDAKGFQYFARDGIATLSVKDVTVDSNGKVWLAQWRHQLISGSTYILTPGSISYKSPGEERFNSMSTWQDRLEGNQQAELPYPAYTYNPPLDKSPQSRNVNAIATDGHETWAAVYPFVTHDTEELLPTRILTYDANNGNFLTQFTFEDCGFSTGGVFNGLYLHPEFGAWATISFQGKGFSVFKQGTWFHMNPEADSVKRVIPPNTRFNNRAIWGNDRGNVFLGTNNGVIVYDGQGPVNYISSYTLYTKSELIAANLNPQMIVDETMISNNIMGGASQKDGGEWIVTDNGIMHGVFGGYKNKETDVWMIPSPSGEGFAVKHEDTWTYMSKTNVEVQKIIPADAKFNSNAIWGNNYGNFFLGTTKGLLVYDGRGPADSLFSYTFYSNESVFDNSPFEVVDPKLLSANILEGKTHADTIQKIRTDNQEFDFKVGFIKTDFDIGVCPTHWRKNTHYCRGNAPSQCLNSVNQSSSPDVILVEAAISQRDPQDHTYHCYQVNTKIGNPKDENGEIYTVERIFELMKNNAKYQAITPYDMPTEVLGDNFLKEVTDEHVERFIDFVNTKTERIPTVQSIMDLDTDLAQYDILDNALLTTFGFIITAPPPAFVIADNILNPSTIEEFQAKQISVNPKKSIHESQIYQLYNTPAAASARATFIKTFPGLTLIEKCGFTNLDDKRYDEVIMHIDETNYTITNYTLPGHYFHPGKIVRTVYRDDATGDIYVRTVGEGLHFCKGNPNGSNPRNDVGSFSGRLNTIMGMILFKNVDLRLRGATLDPSNWRN